MDRISPNTMLMIWQGIVLIVNVWVVYWVLRFAYRKWQKLKSHFRSGMNQDE